MTTCRWPQDFQTGSTPIIRDMPMDRRLPQWLSGKESTCSTRDMVDSGSIPGLGRSPRGGNGNLLQYSCLVGYSPCSHKESDTSERLTTHTHTHMFRGRWKHRSGNFGSPWKHSLACCSPWSRKELDTTEWLNWTELKASTAHLPGSVFSSKPYSILELDSCICLDAHLPKRCFQSRLLRLSKLVG